MRAFRFIILLCLALFGCAPEFTLVNNPRAQDDESETFGYRRWLRPNTEPNIVVIGIHGFCGASVDYQNLGEHLVKNQPRTAVYAYEIRGQGSDPIHHRRGDIGKPDEWYRDLNAFTQLVRERHPKAKIIWYGESMGALIATHALDAAPDGSPPCDALAISSPIVRFNEDVEPWKVALIQVAASTLPLARVSLDAITAPDEIQMTQTTSHGKQAAKNPYHVEQHTLRLLGTLARLIDGMNACASRLEVPVLVLHGGKDHFNNDADMRGFIARVPAKVSKTYRHYPDAYHLLMYDENRDKIFRDVERWINRVRRM